MSTEHSSQEVYQQNASRSKLRSQVKSFRSRSGLWFWWSLWISLILLGLVLAHWQWQRADEKTQLLAQQAAAEHLTNPTDLPENLSRLTLTGQYLADQTLWLDNRIYQGQVGVAVLTPLQTDTGHWWLIQRGFIPTAVDRRIEPVVETPAGDVQLSGIWQRLETGYWVLGDNLEGNRLQSLDLSPWSHLPGEVFQGVVHQTEGAGHTVSWWQPSQMPPERHIAYAVQWLSLALMALIVAVAGQRKLWGRSAQQEAR
ncbi:SURF1 family protein [Nitrincola lacisaponensis]|uniref:SURF1 family protein n=1 Tax=Nitrincola lacisaponensis TaxID=267850 RepID=UPI0013774464|nr:SURF1 family protein [Nitrincola lacisaponensis]